MSEENELPRGWSEALLGEVFQILDSKRVPVNAVERANRQGPYPYYGANGQAGTIDGYLFDDDLALLAEDGGNFSEPTKGVAYRATGKFWVNNHAHVLRGMCSMGTPFIVHWLNAMNWMPYVSGSTRLKLTQGRMREARFNLPPLAEQRRIVAKIEALQARSRRAREALESVPKLLEKFRQSVLAAAFRGDLTADWRKAHPDVEPASELLKRIRKQRRQKWEQAELAKYEAKGKKPPSGWKEKYKEPEPVDANGLPTLPIGWCWITAGQACEYITKGTTPPKGTMTAGQGEIPFVKVYNLTDRGHLDFSVNPTFISRSTHENGALARSKTLPGDVLMNLVGPPLGKVSLVPDEFDEWNCNQAIAIYRVIPGLANRFLTYALLTQPILRRIVMRAKATAGQRNLTLELARDLPIPLAPAEEQQVVAATLDVQLGLIRRARGIVTPQVRIIDQLDQSILAKAFRGELAPQDPSDEPASALLERIRREREVTNGAKASKRTPRQKKAAKSRTRAEDDEPAGPAVTLTQEVDDIGGVSQSSTSANEKPAPRAATRQQTLLDYATDEIMAHFRQACWGAGEMTETELLRAVAQRLGYARLSSNVHAELKNHLKAAVRRRIVERDGEYVHCPTSIFRNYDDESLLKALKPAMRKGYEYEREDVIFNVAQHLGYSQVTEAMRRHMKPIFNSAIRRGLLGRQGTWVWREK